MFSSKYCCLKSFHTTGINDDFMKKTVVSVDIYGTALSKNKYFQFTQGKKYWMKNIFLSFY